MSDIIQDDDHGEAQAAMGSRKTVGQVLRQERENKDYSLEEISAAINIRVPLLAAIEEDNMDALPGMTYALGFVRSYAEYLDLDPDRASQLFKTAHVEEVDKSDLVFPAPLSANRRPNNIIFLVSGVSLVLVMIIFSLFMSGDEDSFVENVIPDVPAEIVEAMERAEATPNIEIKEEELNSQKDIETKTILGVQAPTVTKEIRDSLQQGIEEVKTAESAIVKEKPVIRQVRQARSTSRIIIKAWKSSWIQVTDSKGKVLFKKVLRPGDKYSVPNNKDLVLATSDAGALDIYVDGKKIKPLGKEGDIIRGVALNPKELL